MRVLTLQRAKTYFATLHLDGFLALTVGASSTPRQSRHKCSRARAYVCLYFVLMLGINPTRVCTRFQRIVFTDLIRIGRRHYPGEKIAMRVDQLALPVFFRRGLPRRRARRVLKCRCCHTKNEDLTLLTVVVI